MVSYCARTSFSWTSLISSFLQPRSTSNHHANTSTDPAISSIEAPTASNVWKVQVEAGETVSAGQTVAILEAMKLEINVDVPQDWAETKVEKVLVQPGEVVKAGDRLALLRSVKGA